METIDSKYKVTITITAYNVEKYIAKALDSAIRQTYKNIEIFVVNDGSNDRTAEIIREIQRNNNWIHYYEQINSGVSVARNYGINHASGDYICFLDGDDYLSENFIEEMIRHLDKNTDILACCCNAFGEEKFVDHFYNQDYTMDTMEDKERLFMQLLNGNYGKPNGKGSTAIGVPWGKLYKLSRLRENSVLFDPTLRRMQDNMFNMYAFYYAHQVKYIDMPLYNYRLEHIRKRSTLYNTDIWEKLLVAREKFYKNHCDFITENISKAIFYEYNVALAASALFVVQNEKFLGARLKLKELKNKNIYRILFETWHRNGEPFKFYLIKLLMLCGLYFPVYVGLKIR